MTTRWWQDKIIYQIYPMSFNDSNGDGIGDIPGIIEKLDYLAALGVDLLWISPLYPSPNCDNGYDISDYCAIHPDYGTMEDFDRLVRLAKDRGIGILMDLVVNHTSDQHAWFQKSRRRIDPYTDFYIWKPSRDAGKGARGALPNNWGNFFGEIPWTWDDVRGEYYLHLFAKGQPDLNYKNEKVIEAVEEVMAFWLDRGVVGFRCDVINILYKETLANGKPRPVLAGIEHYLSTPGLHRLLHRFNQNVWSKYDAFTVGETVFVTPKMADDLSNPVREELSTVFSFDHMGADCFKVKWFLRPFSPARLYQTLTQWQEELFWNTLYFENHDQPRSVSRFGNTARYHRESAKALAILLMGLRGTVFLYQGEEIGMTNFDFSSMDELRDIESFNIWKLGERLHLPKRLLWKMMASKSRDNARTPMQWTGEANGGFTTGTPWIGVNGNHEYLNVQQEEADPASILHFYQRLIRFRKTSKALTRGRFKELYRKGSVYAFEREDAVPHPAAEGEGAAEKLVVVVNLSDKPKRSPCRGACLFSSYEKDAVGDTLDPYEAAVIKTR